MTAEQVGAISQAALDAHVNDLANPHQVTAAQVGADPVGSAAAPVDNGTLAPGQSTTFGLQGTHDGSFDPPTT